MQHLQLTHPCDCAAADGYQGHPLTQRLLTPCDPRRIRRESSRVADSARRQWVLRSSTWRVTW